MNTLTLKNSFQTNATLVANNFIDHYMAPANGEFVKVYLFLLRHLDDPCSSITVPMIADCLNNTENDILRAFRYWESKGLLRPEKDADGRITGIELIQNPMSHKAGAEEKTAESFLSDRDSAEGQEHSHRTSDRPDTGRTLPDATVSRPVKTIPLNSFRAQKELKSLLFIAEQYLGKTLSHTEAEAITYFYDTLGMSADLIEYLIETCVENGHKSIHYIQKVALSWSDDGVETIEQARRRSVDYNKNYYTILHAFGIKNRGPAAPEIHYIKKWTESFGFTLDIIQEACSRTVTATHQPSFEYADTILEKWHAGQVHCLKDIAALDAAYQKEKNSRKPAVPRLKTASKNLNNFERRTYDMEALEEQLLNSN